TLPLVSRGAADESGGMSTRKRSQITSSQSRAGSLLQSPHDKTSNPDKITKQSSNGAMTREDGQGARSAGSLADGRTPRSSRDNLIRRQEEVEVCCTRSNLINGTGPANRGHMSAASFSIQFVRLLLNTWTSQQHMPDTQYIYSAGSDQASHPTVFINTTIGLLGSAGSGRSWTRLYT
ncbi:hypothetical protein BaRGS_00031805, partial [Batillaria attramentaria]